MLHFSQIGTGKTRHFFTSKMTELPQGKIVTPRLSTTGATSWIGARFRTPLSMKIPRHITAACFAIASILSAASLQAATFVISSNSTTAQTLGTASGQTGTVNSGVSLTVSGSTVAVTISGNNETLTNLGTISQTGTGRAIRDNTGVTGLVINNGSSTNSAALMQTADADVIQMNKAVASVTLNNYGTMTSLNASAGGAQVVDFNALTSGSNIVNNHAGAFMLANEADAVRPGVSGFVYNDGTIKSTTATGSGSDGVDAQNNNNITIINANAGNSTSANLIEGARHGITGGPVDSSTAYTMSITNNLYGTIQGDNGSGVNIDGFNALETVTIVNHGLITGNGHDISDGASHDGDGIDVDGLVNLTNTGTIRSINAFSIAADGVAQSEGISVGGGTIINSGTIEGLVASGNTNAVGRGISLLGNDITTGPLAGTREAIYADATVTNQAGGLIRGDSDSAIAVGGPASGHIVTINNNAGATIQGGGTVNAAILTGADNDTINNAGIIDGSSSGQAISMGDGNDTLSITGGSITGSIDGGTGTNTATLDPGTGNTFSYAGSFANFSSVDISSGNVILSGASTYSGNTTVSGTLTVTNTSGSATGSGSVMVNSGGTLNGTGTIGGDVSLASGGMLAPGLSPGTLTIDGSLDLVGGSHLAFDLGSTSDLLNIGGTLNFSGGGTALFDILSNGLTAGADYTLMNYSSATGLTLANLGFGSTPAGFAGEFTIGATSLTLHVDAAPEPSRALFAGLGLALLALRRRRACTTAAA